MVAAFVTVGQFYDRGDGVKADENEALYWYRRASQHGSDSAANNIGCIWRDRGDLARALHWFERAVVLGDPEANLNIGKIYLNKGEVARARNSLSKANRSPWVTEQSKEQARLLLKESKNVKQGRSGRNMRVKSATARIRSR